MDFTFEQGRAAVKKMTERASCRSFSDKSIPKDILDDLLDAALCAASGGNLQPLSIILLDKKEDNEKMAKICGEQKFIAEAPVNFLFVLDWYKMKIYAKSQDAPYTCDKSFMHFLIGLEDVMCTAQTVETAAHLLGLGSCYVGTTNHEGAVIAKEYNLPQHTYPVLLLSVGYPKVTPAIRKKLHRDIMVFNDRYPNLTDEFVIEKYAEKYGEASMSLTKNEPYRSETLEDLRTALETSFDSAETSRILRHIEETNTILETQRRFGLHYHAAGMREAGKEIIEMIERQGLRPFDKQ